MVDQSLIGQLECLLVSMHRVAFASLPWICLSNLWLWHVPIVEEWEEKKREVSTTDHSQKQTNRSRWPQIRIQIQRAGHLASACNWWGNNRTRSSIRLKRILICRQPRGHSSLPFWYLFVYYCFYYYNNDSSKYRSKRWEILVLQYKPCTPCVWA